MKFIKNLGRLSFVILMYLFTLSLSIVSAGFSIIFYIDGQEEEKKLLIGLLALIFELVKVSLAITLPYMEYRDNKVERSVKRILYFALFMSIMASLYFFMSEGDKVTISPATKVIELVYANIAVLNILPKTFIIFTANMSLSVMVEVLIIKLPSFALIFYKIQDRSRSKTISTKLSKLLAIPGILINHKIDQIFKKYITAEMQQSQNIQVVERKENPLMIESRESISVTAKSEGSNLNATNNQEKQKDNSYVFGENRVVEFLELLKNTAKEDGQILSTNELILNGYTRDEIRELKDLVNSFLTVKGNKTYIKEVASDG
jgi:hypothetical protein